MYNCMPDEARDGRNVAFELSSDLLVCSIVQRNHSTITVLYHNYFNTNVHDRCECIPFMKFETIIDFWCSTEAYFPRKL